MTLGCLDIPSPLTLDLAARWSWRSQRGGKYRPSYVSCIDRFSELSYTNPNHAALGSLLTTSIPGPAFAGPVGGSHFNLPDLGALEDRRILPLNFRSDRGHDGSTFVGDELGKLSVLSSEMFLGRDRRDPLSGIESGPAYLLKLRRRFGPSSKDEYIDVDSTVTKLFIFLNAMHPVGVELSTPDGSLVTEATPGVKVEQYSSGCLVMIENVRPGTWRVRVEGSSHVVVHVEGRTPIVFSRSITSGGVGGPVIKVGSISKIAPRVGEQHRAEATLFGPEAYDQLEEFQIRSLEGDVVTRIPFEQEKGRDYLVGPLDVPGKCLESTSPVATSTATRFKECTLTRLKGSHLLNQGRHPWRSVAHHGRNRQ